MNDFRPCDTCEINTCGLSNPEAKAAGKDVVQIERRGYLDVTELAYVHKELTVMQAVAITACLEARVDRTCARYLVQAQ
jgi:hypothetical protein